MATFTESFTSGDNVPLGDAASTCDLTWTHVQGGDPWATFGGGASPRGNVRGLVEFARADHDTTGSDMYAQVVVTALSASSQCGPAIRFQPAASTFYGVEVFGNGDILIQKLIAGTRTTIGAGSVAVALPQTLRLEVVGDTLTAFWDGVQCATAVDTDIPAGTRGGLLGFEQGGQGLGAVLDSFEVGDLGAGGVTGTLTVTEADDTLAATGTHTPPAFTGSLAVAEGNDTLAAAGSFTGVGITGTVAVTEQADALAAAGTSTPPSFTGSLAAVEAADTLAGSGTFDFEGIAGSINVAEGLDTLAAAGTFTPGIVSGVLNVIEEADTLTATGIQTAPVVGTLAVVEAADQLMAAGAVDNSGVVAPTPPERTSVVPAEPRMLVVPAESRTLTIPREDRRAVVPA